VAHSSIAVANRFIELAEANGQKLTNMQIQKLVFLAHGIALALEDKPLISQDVRAWQWGPVVPQLYKRFSAYGAGPITSPAACSEEAITPESGDIIGLVWKSFGQMSGAKLSAMTHLPGSPWDVIWKTDQWGIIPNTLIQDYYKNKLNATEAQGQQIAG
jgi:uncharacterized phage-associated protein